MMLDLESLETQIADAMRAAVAPGLALAVVRGEDVIYARGFGVTSTEGDAPPVTPETLFRIGSVTKPLTATLILRLVAMGRLDLDAPLTDYAPWLVVGEPDAASRMTLRMLLSHTAGLPAALDYTGWRGPDGLARYVRTVIPSLPLVAPPGTAYAYSNPGFNLAGYVAEAAAGQPYVDLMRDLVFAPLGMARTTFDPLRAMTYPLSQSFVLDADGQPVVRRPFIDNSGEYPCGFALSNVLDLARFAMLHLGGGCLEGERLLPPDLLAAMQTPQSPPYTVDGRGYGLGLRTRVYKGVRLVGHNGGIAKYGAAWWLAPDDGVAVILLVNRAAQFWDAAERIVTRIFDALLDLPRESPLQPSASPESARVAYRGAFLGVGAGLAVVEVTDGGLTLTWNGEAIPLRASEPDLYYGVRQASGAVVSVRFVPTGEQVDYLLIDGMLCRRFAYNRAFTPDWTRWADYAGRYQGDIDSWIVRLDGQTMFIYSEDEQAEVRCIPLDDGRVASFFGVCEFVRGDDGAVIELRGGGGLWRYARVNEPPGA